MNPSGFVYWWRDVTDKIHRLAAMTTATKVDVIKKSLKKLALEVFQGSTSNGRCIFESDKEYVMGIERMNITFNKEGTSWEKLVSELENLEAPSMNPSEIRNKIYEAQALLAEMTSAKPSQVTSDEVAGRFYSRLNQIVPYDMYELVKQKIKFNKSTGKAKNEGRWVEVVNLAFAFTLDHISSKGFIKRHKGVTFAKTVKEREEKPKEAVRPSSPSPSPSPRPFRKFNNNPKSKDTKAVKIMSEGAAMQNSEEASSASDEDTPPQWAQELLTRTEKLLSGSPNSNYPSHAQAAEGVDETVDPRVMAFIEKFKNEPCIFQHRNPASHRVWDCAVSVNNKYEQLVALNRCRTCWQEGHTGITCRLRIDFLCEHCGAKNHFKPLCYTYIREVVQARLKAGDQKGTTKKVEASVKSGSTHPNFTQAYNLLKANAAQLQRVNSAATPQPSFMVQSNALPMGPSEQTSTSSQ